MFYVVSTPATTAPNTVSIEFTYYLAFHSNENMCGLFLFLCLAELLGITVVPQEAKFASVRGFLEYFQIVSVYSVSIITFDTASMK
jgi:hypothetical protein